MSEYKFIKFNGFYPRGDNKIALNKSGLIRLSPGFRRDSDTIKFNYVVLFYDSDNKAVAFKFTNASQEGALKVTKDKSGATISATSFMKANKLDQSKYLGRYIWKKQNIPDIGEVFIIELIEK